MGYEYRLKSAVWEITLACCFSCKYCGSGGGKARKDELTTAECLRVCGELADLGCRRVSLIGGEVFLRNDWAEIVRALTASGIRVSIITNGYVFDDGIAEALKSTGAESVAVSLDGLRGVHDKYRQDGSFDRAVRAIRFLASHGIPVSVISTLNAKNARQLPEFCAFLRSLPIFAWQLQACSPMGNAAKSGIDCFFDPREVIRFVEDYRADVPFSLGIADNIGYFTPEEGNLRGRENAPFAGCGAGLSSVGIDSVGNVRGCESMYDDRFIEGNLRGRSLRDIWEDPDAFSYNRSFTPSLLTGACAECEHAPFCAGGCRSYNYFVHGKLYEAPRCARNAKREPPENRAKDAFAHRKEKKKT